MNNEILKEIQNWYLSQCDGDWEHLNGISIETVDNPGWHITINLSDINLSGLSDMELKVENSEQDWYMIVIRESNFIGSGDPLKLQLILDKFLELIQGHR